MNDSIIIIYLFFYAVVIATGMSSLLFDKEDGNRNNRRSYFDLVIKSHIEAVKLIAYPFRKIIQFFNWCKKLKRLKINQLMIFYDDLIRFYPERKDHCRYFSIDENMEVQEYKLIKGNIYQHVGTIDKRRTNIDNFISKLCVKLDTDIDSLKKSLTATNKFNL